MGLESFLVFLVFWRGFFVFLPCLGPLPRHMEVPRLGVEWELSRLPTPEPQQRGIKATVCNLHHSSRQRRILNPLSKSRIEPETSRFLVRCINHCATVELRDWCLFKKKKEGKRDPLFISVAYAQRRGQMRTKRESSQLQARSRGPTGNQA